MTFAINAVDFLFPAGNDDLYIQFASVAASQPSHRFVFIVPPAFKIIPGPPSNILHVESAPRAKNGLMWRLWLNYTLPGIVKKQHAEILIHLYGCCSLRSRLPQWMVMNDVSFLNSPKFFSRLQTGFLKANLPKFFGKSTQVLCGSELAVKAISEKYIAARDKLRVFTPELPAIYHPAGWQEKEVVKERLTGGKEYFLFSGDIHARSNLLNLLKAFSFFKRRQKSNMQLVIATKNTAADLVFTDSLKTYKYRNEVLVLQEQPEAAMAGLMAAAYALVYPVLYEGAHIVPIQAMVCKVPVITSELPAITEFTADAALYADPQNFEDIAYKIMVVFKDEAHRAELIKKGELQLRRIRDGRQELWQYLLNATSNVVPGL